MENSETKNQIISVAEHLIYDIQQGREINRSELNDLFKLVDEYNEEYLKIIHPTQ